jgi:hypothetical protein
MGYCMEYEWVTARSMKPKIVKNKANSMYDRETRYKHSNTTGSTGRQTVKNNLWIFITKPTRCNNYSNLFLE